MASFRRSSLRPLAVAMALALLLGFGLARGLHATGEPGAPGSTPATAIRGAGSNDNLRSQLDVFSQVLYLVENNYVEAPNNELMARFSIELGVKAGVHITTLPVVPASRLEGAVEAQMAAVSIDVHLDPEPFH